MLPVHSDGEHKGKPWTVAQANKKLAEIKVNARAHYEKREKKRHILFDGNDIRRYIAEKWHALCGVEFDCKAWCCANDVVYRTEDEGPALPRQVGPSVGLGTALPTPGERQTLNAPGPSVAGVNASQRTPGSIDDGE